MVDFHTGRSCAATPAAIAFAPAFLKPLKLRLSFVMVRRASSAGPSARAPAAPRPQVRWSTTSGVARSSRPAACGARRPSVERSAARVRAARRRKREARSAGSGGGGPPGRAGSSRPPGRAGSSRPPARGRTSLDAFLEARTAKSNHAFVGSARRDRLAAARADVGPAFFRESDANSPASPLFAARRRARASRRNSTPRRRSRTPLGDPTRTRGEDSASVSRGP